MDHLAYHAQDGFDDMPAIPEDQRLRGYIIPIGGAEGRGKKPAILSRFVELCGAQDARILVIPTASLLNETGPLYQETLHGHGRRIHVCAD